MSIFKKWFGKSDRNDSKVEFTADTMLESRENTPVPDITPDITEDYFQDLPEEKEEAPVEEAPKKKVTDLGAFLKGDYLTEGFNTGYVYQSADQLEIALRHLKAQFRLLIDEGIDARYKEIAELKQELIQSSGISERLQKQMELRIESLTENIERFQIEKELSVADEGMIARVIHNYREGFVRGIEQYRKERLIAGSTGFFN